MSRRNIVRDATCRGAAYNAAAMDDGIDKSLDIQRRYAWPSALALTFVMLALYLFTATRTTLWDRDEPRYATATLEMLASGNWMYPTFNGQLRAAKPILIYWLMAASVKLFGPTELGVRFWASLGMAASALLTYAMGRKLFSPRAGWWAMAVLATSPLMFLTGTAATTDAVLLAFILLAMWPFVCACVDGVRLWHVPVMGVGIGLSMLTKGPVGLAVVLPAMLAAMAVGRDKLALRWKHVGWLALASAIGVAMFLAWAVPANLATAGKFAQVGLGKNVWERMFKAQESHGGPAWYYVPVVLAAFAPWTLHLLGAGRMLLGKRVEGHRGLAVLAGWFVPTFVLMSLIATKLPHYILPVFPAMALMIGGSLEAIRQGRFTEPDRKWMETGLWVYLPVGVGQGVGLLALGLASSWCDCFTGRAHELLSLAQPVAAPAMATGLVVLIVAGRASWQHYHQRYVRSAATLLAGVSVTFLLMSIWLLPATEHVVKLSPSVARAINEMMVRQPMPADEPVAAYQYNEGSLNFYLGGRHVVQLGTDEAVAAWARQPAFGAMVIPLRDLERIERKEGPLPVRKLFVMPGINHANGKYYNLVALWRPACSDDIREEAASSPK
ncbi:MAG: glycosyltransferase family 39 protein [Phycisphaeraceae bacterium]|nr:glycosyltransferase family 39 protein [Phycisphaeraceae bacterium]